MIGRHNSTGIKGSPLGASAEMLVCFDLLKQGLEPYRAISPDASHDLLCCRRGNAQLWSVQVKRGRRWADRRDGRSRIVGGNNQNHHSAVLALALTEGEPKVFYFKPKPGSVFYEDQAIKFWETNV